LNPSRLRLANAEFLPKVNNYSMTGKRYRPRLHAAVSQAGINSNCTHRVLLVYQLETDSHATVWSMRWVERRTRKQLAIGSALGPGSYRVTHAGEGIPATAAAAAPKRISIVFAHALSGSVS
jgi:hypothetical protein